MSQELIESVEKTDVSVLESTDAGSIIDGIKLDGIEKIVEAVHEDGAGDGDDQTTGDDSTVVFSWANISDSVGKLILGNKSNKKFFVPEPAKQKTKLDRFFHKEIRSISRAADRMIGHKSFSADKYEALIAQIRKYRALLEELVGAAADTIELWYKQYVLKIT